MSNHPEEHECDLAAFNARAAGSRLYGIEGIEAGSAEDALRAVLNVERYLRQAQRHIDAFKSRMVAEHGVDQSDFAPSAYAEVPALAMAAE